MDFYIKPVPSRPGHFQIFMDEGNDGTIGDTIIMNPNRDDILFSAEDIVGLLKETGKINDKGAFTADRTGMDQLTDEQKAELDRKGVVSVGANGCSLVWETERRIELCVAPEDRDCWLMRLQGLDKSDQQWRTVNEFVPPNPHTTNLQSVRRSNKAGTEPTVRSTY